MESSGSGLGTGEERDIGKGRGFTQANNTAWQPRSPNPPSNKTQTSRTQTWLPRSPKPSKKPRTNPRTSRIHHLAASEPHPPSKKTLNNPEARAEAKRSRPGKEEGQGREGKGREGKGREGKGREGKGREGKGREGKGKEREREGKGRERTQGEGNTAHSDPPPGLR